MLYEIVKLREAIQQGGPQSAKVLAELMSSGPPPPIPSRNLPQVNSNSQSSCLLLFFVYALRLKITMFYFFYFLDEKGGMLVVLSYK